MTATRNPHRRVMAVGLACLAMLSFTAVACSSGGNADVTTTTDVRQVYCDAWAGLITAFKAYDEIDIVNGGLDSVRSYFDDLDAANQTLDAAASDQLEGEIVAFTDALDNLGSTLTSPSLPVDRRTQVQEASVAVDTAWNDLVAALTADCPSVTAPTVAPVAG